MLGFPADKIKLSLADTPKMEGNDFILFKHACGNDSSYMVAPDDPFTELSDEGKERMKTPCENFKFYHVEVEYIRNRLCFYTSGMDFVFPVLISVLPVIL